MKNLEQHILQITSDLNRWQPYMDLCKLSAGNLVFRKQGFMHLDSLSRPVN